MDEGALFAQPGMVAEEVEPASFMEFEQPCQGQADQSNHRLSKASGQASAPTDILIYSAVRTSIKM